MANQKYQQEDGWATFCGIIFLIAGISMLFQGYNAYLSGTIIPLTGKHGPMSGPEFMVAGGMVSIFGFGLLVNELVKARRRNQK